MLLSNPPKPPQEHRQAHPAQGAGAGGAPVPLRVSITGGVSNNRWLVSSILAHLQHAHHVNNVISHNGGLQAGNNNGNKQPALGGLMSPYLRGHRL